MCHDSQMGQLKRCQQLAMSMNHPGITARAAIT